MKTPQFLRPLAAAILLGAAPVALLAQGPLTPPGPPAPTMKTLVEMEPRTHITALPYIITASGSYYLTSTLSGGGSSQGIIIQASGVTIDLRGFSIESCTTGITGSGITDVAIHNGQIRGCSGNGIDLGGANKVRLESVMVSDNSGSGAVVGETSLVTLCTAKGNGSNGITLGNGGKISQCLAQANGGSGIAVTSSCQITENNSNNNGSGAGFMTAGNGNRVEGNSANENKYGFLINGTANLVVRNNACSSAVSDYSVSAGNNYGQVLVSPGPAFANSNAWANFGCGPSNPQGCATAADCDDRNACTTDVCQATVCINTPIPDCGGEAVCGDGILQGGEACDDGNLVSGDGCTSSCQSEGCNTAADCPGMDTACQTRTCNSGVCGTNFSAAGTPAGSQTAGDCQQIVCDGAGNVVNVANNADLPPDDGNQCTAETCMSGIPSNVVLPQGTPCSQNGGVVCDANGACVDNSVCGDGIVQGGEACDDGNATNGDGCTAVCTVQSGFTCVGSPSVCVSVCGDGIVGGSESCDDGNGVSGDGCNSICSIESGYSCFGSPSVCVSTCGDGIVGGSESCDDGNAVPGDGCNSICTVESGFNCVGSPSVCSAIGYSLSTSKTGTGSGTITSSPAGINCGADCSEIYSNGTMVNLTASPGVSSTFAGWSGACTGTGSCVVTMNAAKSVNATFTANTYTLSVAKGGSGNGTVTSTPAGITCGVDCTEPYTSGTMVSLTATPLAGSSFAGWSGGGCSGTGTCVVSVTSATAVTAMFSNP